MQSYTASCVAISGLLFAGWTTPANAQGHEDWERAHRIIEKTQEDLRHIEHHDMWAVADRGHYEKAERNLADIRRDLDQSRLDRGRLDETMAEIEHITHVGAIDREARERLSGDLHELHRLRDDWHWR
jgi:hypothetical protein